MSIERHSKVFVPVRVDDAAKLDVDKIIKVSKGHKEGGYFPYGFAEEKENVYVLSEQELKELLCQYEMKFKNNDLISPTTFLQSKTNPQTENK